MSFTVIIILYVAFFAVIAVIGIVDEVIARRRYRAEEKRARAAITASLARRERTEQRSPR